MSENFSIRMTYARSDSPNKLADLNDGIRPQLMQLHLTFVKNIQKNRVWRYAKASGEEIFEYNRLILFGIWKRFYTGQLSKPSWKEAKGILKSRDAGPGDFRLLKIIAYSGKNNFHRKFLATTIVGNIPAIVGVVGLILLIRSDISFGGSLRRDISLLISGGRIRLVS
jgi:hypothetical protein